MEVKIFISDILEENIYLLINSEKQCSIIDPGGSNVDELIKYIQEENLDLKMVLITHGHFDHIKSIEKIIEFKKVPVYIGKEDVRFLYDSSYSLSRAFLGEELSIDKNIEVIEVNDKDIIFDLQAISTPGHTAGSTCYYSQNDKMVFTGDTLFYGAYGRTDFPSGDAMKLRESINKLFSLESDTIVYPGHGRSTTIRSEQGYFDFY